MSDERKAMLAFLQDVAESEHHLRHPEAFAAVVEASGFTLEKLPHRFEVSDPDAKALRTLASLAEDGVRDV